MNILKIFVTIMIFDSLITLWREIVISISRSGLLNSCARFIIERSEIRKKQHDSKSVE